MYSTQAIKEIQDYLLDHEGINLAFSICNSKKLNKVIIEYRHGEILLEEAALKAKQSIVVLAR